MLLAEVTVSSPLQKLLSMPAPLSECGTGGSDGDDAFTPSVLNESISDGWSASKADGSPVGSDEMASRALRLPRPKFVDDDDPSGGHSEEARGGDAEGDTSVPDASASARSHGRGIEESEGYQALLQLLRAKTPAELLKASSRLCMHVTDEPAAASCSGGGPSGGWLDTPG